MKIFNLKLKQILNIVKLSFIIFCINFNNADQAVSFPIFAQQAYITPREANGRIVCANCHLAQKPIEIESPQAVLPNTVFETIIKIPYDIQSKQILGTGKFGSLNVGAVVILPEGFKLAPKEKISEEILKKKIKVFI